MIAVTASLRGKLASAARLASALALPTSAAGAGAMGDGVAWPVRPDGVMKLPPTMVTRRRAGEFASWIGRLASAVHGARYRRADQRTGTARRAGRGLRQL